MNTLKNIVYRILPVILLVSVWVSCKDTEEQLNLSRQFRPAKFDITSGETSATVIWNASLFTISGDVEYLFEVSRDGVNFTDIEFSTTTNKAEVEILDTDIDIKTIYYARVKAIGKNGVGDSNWLISETFGIKGEIFIKPIVESDVVADGVKIKWIPGKDVTKIKITSLVGAPVEVSVNDVEKNAGEKIISGLNASTKYTVEVFNIDNVDKGSLTFTTKPSYQGSNIIDLRGITGRPKVLGDTLNQIPSGSVVFLKRGMIYTIDASDPTTSRTFDKSVTIISGDDYISDFATIKLTTNFNLIVNSVIDSIVFKDVNFKGARAAGASFNNDYILNVNVVSTVGKIGIENCNAHALRGTVRLQAGGAGCKVANYTVNNCVIDSIREYGVAFASGGSAFANIKISNSTISKCRRFIDHRVTGNNTLVMENCTFNELPTGQVAGGVSNYFIDFNTFTSVNPIVMSNCIVGKTWIEAIGEVDVRGFRAASGTALSVGNSYTLSDFVSTNTGFQLPGFLPYSGSSEAVFTAPGTGDFTIKDNAFPGKSSAGDPRWR